MEAAGFREAGEARLDLQSMSRMGNAATFELANGTRTKARSCDLSLPRRSATEGVTQRGERSSVRLMRYRSMARPNAATAPARLAAFSGDSSA